MITPAYITKEMADDFEDSLRIGAEAGIATVSIRSKVWGSAVEDLNNEQIKKVQHLLKSYHQRVAAILSPVGKCDIEDDVAAASQVEIFRRTVPLAKALETRLIRVFPWRRRGYTEYEPSRLEEYLDLIVERTKPLIEICETESMSMVFECVGSTLARTCRELRRILDALGNPPCARAVWEIDVGAKAGESPEEGYPYLRGLIEDVHVKCNSAVNIDPIDGAEGTYAGAFRLLANDGYDGFATIEHWPRTEGTLRGLGQLRELLNQTP